MRSRPGRQHRKVRGEILPGGRFAFSAVLRPEKPREMTLISNSPYRTNAVAGSFSAVRHAPGALGCVRNESALFDDEGCYLVDALAAFQIGKHKGTLAAHY